MAYFYSDSDCKEFLILVQTSIIFCFFTGKCNSNFDVEILLRKEFSYFLKCEASFLGNGNRGKMLKKG